MILGIFLFNTTIDDLESGCLDLVDMGPVSEDSGRQNKPLHGSDDDKMIDDNGIVFSQSTPAKITELRDDFTVAASPVLPLY